MTPDDLLESNAYFVRPEYREKREQQAEAEEPSPPADRRKQLVEIAADPAESVSVRMDARRLIEVADLRPRDFDREFSDFITWRKETKKNGRDSRTLH